MFICIKFFTALIPYHSGTEYNVFGFFLMLKVGIVVLFRNIIEILSNAFPTEIWHKEVHLIYKCTTAKQVFFSTRITFFKLFHQDHFIISFWHQCSHTCMTCSHHKAYGGLYGGHIRDTHLGTVINISTCLKNVILSNL